MGEPARFLLRTSVLTRFLLPLFYFVICYSRYDSRRQALLTEGVDPADLSVFGVALTQGLSPSKRVTDAVVAVRFLGWALVFFLADPDHAPTQSYKAQFLLTRQQQKHPEPQPQPNVKTNKTLGCSLTREESLLSIADAIRPPGLGPETDMADEPELPAVTRRGHSVSSNDDLRTLFHLICRP